MKQTDATILVTDKYRGQQVDHLGTQNGSQIYGVINTTDPNTTGRDPFYVEVKPSGRLLEHYAPLVADNAYYGSKFDQLERQYTYFERHGILD